MKLHTHIARLVSLALCLLVGCATTGVKPTNPAVVERLRSVDQTQMATVVIYRESNFYGGALRPTRGGSLLALRRPEVVNFNQSNARAVVQSREQSGVKARRQRRRYGRLEFIARR